MTRLLLIVAMLMAAPCLALEVGELVQLSAAGVTATGIDIATDVDGNAYVIWAQKGPPQPGRGHASDDDLFLARWAADERRPASINRVNPRPGEAKSSAVSRARVAVDEEGVVHVLYPANAVSPVTGKPVIDVRYARSLDGGRRFAAPITLNTPAVNDLTATSHSNIAAAATFVAMALGPEGRVYAFWLDSRHSAHAESPSSVYAAMSTDRGASWSGDLGLFNEACECCQPIALGAAGAVLLTSRRVSADGYRDPVLTRVSYELTTEDEPARIGVARWAIEGCPMKSAAIGSAGERVYVAWYSQADAPPGVWLARSSDGGRSLDAGVPLHPDADVSDAPVLAVDGDRVVVAWHAKTGGARRVFVSTSVDGGARFAPPVAVSPEGEAAGYPAIALTGSSALVAWQQGTAVVAARLGLD